MNERVLYLPAGLDIVTKAEKTDMPKGGYLGNAEKGQTIIAQEWVLPPGTILQPHEHDGMQELFSLVRGDDVRLFLHKKDDPAYQEEIPLQEGNVTRPVIPGIIHTFVNLGDTEATLNAFGICTMEGGVTTPHTISQNNSGEVNTQQRTTEDTRKTRFTVGLLMKHRDAVAIWKDYDLLVKETIHDESAAETVKDKRHHIRYANKRLQWETRARGAPEHMVTVASGVQSLAQLFVEKQLLNSGHVLELEEAALLHDAGKNFEYELVNKASAKAVTKADFRKLVAETQGGIKNRTELFNQIMKNTCSDNSKTSGERALAAFYLSEKVNRRRLKDSGVKSIAILNMVDSVAFTSCDDMESLMKDYDNLTKTKKQRALQQLIMHYVDDLVTYPNIIDPEIAEENGDRIGTLERRYKQLEANPNYEHWNNAYAETHVGETAIQAQRRVGNKVQEFLAEKLGIKDPLDLPRTIDERIKKNIAQHASYTITF